MKKIVFMGDSPTYNTGFAYVLRNIFGYIASLKKYEIYCVGWHYDGGRYDKEKIPYPILPAKPYGVRELYKAIRDIQPDIVFTLADLFMIRDIPEMMSKIDKFICPKWVAYFPVDSKPIHSADKYLLRSIDVPITYSKFAQDACRELCPNINVELIYHGIHPQEYPIFNKNEIKQEQGFGSNYVVGFIGTNQIRKQPDRILESFNKFLCGYYNDPATDKSICKNCEKRCSKFSNQKPEAILYLHTQVNTRYEGKTDFVGYDLQELITRYKLKNQIWMTPNINFVKGLNHPQYVTLFNAFDILWLGSMGEGCGIPIMEAACLGIPAISIDYAATEYNPEPKNLIRPITFVTDLQLSTRRAIADIDHTVELLNRNYYIWKNQGNIFYPEFQKYIVNNYEWKNILPLWDSIFEKL